MTEVGSRSDLYPIEILKQLQFRFILYNCSYISYASLVNELAVGHLRT